MHGRPRKPAKVQDPAASAAKAEKLRALQNQLLYNHHNHIYTKEALEVCSKLLEVNPEVYTAWNYRKLAFQCNLQSLSDPGAIKSVLNDELRVAEIALRRNPKCYGAWHHRKWVMQREFSLINHDHEFRLLDQLLKADSRNFHGWNHRRFVAALKNMKEEDELQFTTDKINANFSNYSAWHNRSVLLSHLLKHKDPGITPREKVLTEEFELVHQALFTDPDDQSGWFYYLWLLDQTTSSEDPLLISSWPSQGSDLVFSTNGNADNYMLPIMSSHSYYVPHGETFPIVLCFNQPVKGVNSETVTVQSMLNMNEDINWRPLSTTNSEQACFWVTYLKIPKVTCSLSESYPVEVSLGHSTGIISSSGSQYAFSSRFGFTLILNSVGSEHTKEELDMNMFTWNDDNFFTSESCLPESLISGSFEQLRISKDSKLGSSKWQIETLYNEIALFRELLSEINCKIAKLTLARLLVVHDAIMVCGGPSIQKGTYSDEVLELYDDLMNLDPSHMRYYKDERSLVLMNQVTTDKEFLARHYWHHKEITSSCLHHHVRLNKLSLSRIGFVERFLWVRVLDLSQNELRSIEGLEAMQVLSCLNLSNNKISSFTALEPLKLMSSLRVLDISYNEIGSHSIDTTRYLCASPLSHNAECGWNVHQHHGIIDGVKESSNYWEAILVLKDLRLSQLDTRGNAISTGTFRMLILEVLKLPTLKWFDGTLV